MKTDACKWNPWLRDLQNLILHQERQCRKSKEKCPLWTQQEAGKRLDHFHTHISAYLGKRKIRHYLVLRSVCVISPHRHAPCCWHPRMAVLSQVPNRRLQSQGERSIPITKSSRSPSWGTKQFSALDNLWIQSRGGCNVDLPSQMQAFPQPLAKMPSLNCFWGCCAARNLYLVWL